MRQTHSCWHDGFGKPSAWLSRESLKYTDGRFQLILGKGTFSTFRQLFGKLQGVKLQSFFAPCTPLTGSVLGEQYVAGVRDETYFCLENMLEPPKLLCSVTVRLFIGDSLACAPVKEH